MEKYLKISLESIVPYDSLSPLFS